MSKFVIYAFIQVNLIMNAFPKSSSPTSIGFDQCRGIPFEGLILSNLLIDRVCWECSDMSSNLSCHAFNSFAVNIEFFYCSSPL